MSSTGKNKRLDEWLVEWGLCEDLRVARSLILQGRVLYRDTPEHSAGRRLSESARDFIRLRGKSFAARSAYKLKDTIEQNAVLVKDAVVFDLGCGPGGFSQVLLQAGPRLLVLVDIARDIVVESLRRHERVVVLEKTHAKSLYCPDFFSGVEAPDLFWQNRAENDLPAGLVEARLSGRLPLAPGQRIVFTSDISFLPAREYLPVLFEFHRAAAGGQLDIFALIKPQFELPAEKLHASKGIASDEDGRRVCDGLVEWLQAWPAEYNRRFEQAAPAPLLEVVSFEKAPVRGRSGNQEYLLHLQVKRQSLKIPHAVSYTG